MRKLLDDMDVSTLYSMRDQGMSVYEIAKACDVTPAYISCLLRGIKPGTQLVSKEDIMRLHDMGKTPKEIAEQLGVSVTTIRQRLKKAGFGKKHIDTDEVVRLHNEGMNNMEIARELGCSEMTVRYHLKKGEERVDFSERVKKVDTLPVVEPVTPVVNNVPKVSKVAELPEVWGGMVTMSRVDEIGNDKRRYRVVFDNDKVTVTLVTASGIELTMDYAEIAGMGNELAAIYRRYGENPMMTWEAV